MRPLSFDTVNIALPANAAWRDCERQIKAFEEAWRGGTQPVIEDYLIATRDRVALLVELVHVDLEFRFKSGGEPRSESYFARFPELEQEAERAIELLAAEYTLRQRHRGEGNVEDFCARFPALADALTSYLRRDPPTHLGTASLGAVRPKVERPNVQGYEILAELGQGGMGIVYQARDLNLDRLVAMKFLPSAYSRDPDRLARFAREARTASALNHPHICTIHALGEHEGRPFIVMEYVEGVTMESMVGKPVELTCLQDWLGQAARALAVAHAAGVVHRDIKPANLMVRADGYVKVLDFGLARRLPTLGGRSDELDTDPGVFLGTAAYASPEQARGETVSSASDVFSLGIVLYELATGHHPFKGETSLAMLMAINSHHPIAPTRMNPEIPVALDGLITAMLNKEAALRPTVVEVASSLASLSGAGASARRAAPVIQQRPVVPREPERAVLASSFARAEAGRGAIVCVAGEPGIGKTTFVEDFLDRLATPSAVCLVARGRCSERLSGTEAYLPVIDALGDLLRTDPTAATARLLKVVAPTWYAQVAPNSGPRNQGLPTGSGETQVSASSQQAFLREFVAFVQESSRLGAVVLFLDDIHWADNSTVDLLAHLGRHVQGLRLLVIVTCRPTELLLAPHPFHGVKLELLGKGICTELPLGLLDPSQIDHYLTLAFEGHAFPQDFSDLIHARTEGSPLFMVELLRYLSDRGVIAETEGRWSLASEVPDFQHDLPASVRGMIQRKIERLGGDDHRLLTAACVQGHEFDSALVAHVLGLDVERVEERLQVLERVHGLVRLVREHEYPNRQVTLRYAFVHGLYQQALYAHLTPSRRGGLSLALAEALASHQTGGHHAAAAELACLYEVGRDFSQAARYFWQAAQNAARLHADREAAVLAERGLRQLDCVADSPERSELELSLQMTLGLQLQVTDGYAAPAAHRAYTRARALCEHAGKSPPFPVLWGLWLHAKVQSQLDRATELADELRLLAQQMSDRALALQAQQAQTVTALCRGEPAAALRNMEHGALLYDPQRHRGHSFEFGQDPDVACRAFAAVALWLLGHPDQAARMSDEAVERSHELRHPSTQSLALHFAAMLHQLRRDAARARVFSELSGAIASEHGLSFWAAGAAVLHGWALAEQGEGDGVAQLRRGLTEWLGTGSVTYQTYYLGLLAEALGKRGAVGEALRILDEALVLTLRTGECLYLAELHRMRGELLAKAGQAPLSRAQFDRIEQEFRMALDISQRQEANALTLRAALSLACFNQGRAGAEESRAFLRRTYRSFAEGLQTYDLQEARQFLEGGARG